MRIKSQFTMLQLILNISEILDFEHIMHTIKHRIRYSKPTNFATWTTLILFLFCISFQSAIGQDMLTSKIKGITMVAPKTEFHNNPVAEITAHKANWVTLVPFAFMREGETALAYGNSWQWWGETPDGIRKSARLATQEGLQIMLKPQVYVPGSWIGDVNFKSDKDWIVWEKNYRKYIMLMVDIAIEENISMICIGTEINHSVKKREEFWRTLISDIRAKYKGKLVYSANWDSYKDVPVWDALDFVGISAYFPLSKTSTPTQRELLSKWRPIINKLGLFSKNVNKQIVFTEFGYLSVDGCAHKAWELEKEVHQLNLNEQAQANAIDALFMAHWNQDYWAGGFLWKWFPNMQGHEGYPDKDYTPQGKKSADVLKKWFARN